VTSVTVRRGDLYEVLGVTPAATAEEIGAAFRTHAKRLHPDRNPGDARAVEQFKDLTLAYQTLIRPGARAAYDRRHRPARVTPAVPPVVSRGPLFRTSGRARAAVVAGIAFLVLGVALAAVLFAVDTGDAGETVTLWIAAAKLLLGGPVLAGAGLVRLRRLATER
jgi:preprotein translocase subunit Sec63